MAGKRTQGQAAETSAQTLDDPLFGPDAERYTPSKASALDVKLLYAAVIATCFLAVLGICWATVGKVTLWGVALALVAAVLVRLGFHIAMEWERIVVFRLGAFKRVAGPGPLLTIPFVDQCAMRVDMRTVVTPFGAERTLTSDLVPVNIDAVLFWMVWDAKKACIEVEDYFASVLSVAQTAMRDAIGRMTVAGVALNREQLDRELKEVIEAETTPWGIAVLSVKVRDIVIPEELQEAMSLEAQAEREKNARMTLAEAEKDISELLYDASLVYDKSESGMKLRALHVLYDTVRKSEGTVVTVPSAISDGMAGSLSDALADVAKP